MPHPTTTAVRLSRRSALAGLLAGAAAAALPAAAGLPGAAAHAASAHAASEPLAAIVLRRINDHREAHGLPRLPEDHHLSGVAASWSVRMAGGRGLAHNPDAMAEYGWPTSRSGEIVAYVRNGRMSREELAHQVVENWMGSSGHRAIILGDRWTDVGIGVHVDGDGRLWGTGNFITAPLPSQGQEALALSRASIPDGSAPRVVLVRGDLAADALAGSALADGASPILFARPHQPLPAELVAEIRRIAAPGCHAYLVGGALHRDVDAQVAGTGAQALRLPGASRYATAAAVAREVGVRRGQPSRLYLVRADQWADAVSVAGLAARHGHPVLLVDRDRVPEETARHLRDTPDAERVVIGGEAAISDAVLRQVGGRRVTGTDRAATGATVMADLWQRPRAAAGQHLVVTPGWTADGWATALAHTTLAARHGAPLLFADAGVPAPVQRALQDAGYGQGAQAALVFARGVAPSARDAYRSATGG